MGSDIFSTHPTSALITRSRAVDHRLLGPRDAAGDKADDHALEEIHSGLPLQIRRDCLVR